MNNSNDEYKLRQGWNIIYITDIFKNVPFYVRGNEFTSQLFHFVDNILVNTDKNISSFADAANTQRIIEEIRKDSKANMGVI